MMSGRIEGVGRRCRTAVGILALLAALVLALPAVASKTGAAKTADH
jgi:hypothetical protein